MNIVTYLTAISFECNLLPSVLLIADFLRALAHKHDTIFRQNIVSRHDVVSWKSTNECPVFYKFLQFIRKSP